jgi:hypothetical protein
MTTDVPRGPELVSPGMFLFSPSPGAAQLHFRAFGEAGKI